MSDFSDATLLLIGHGSTLNAESALPVYQHAAELRGRNLFGQVLEGFWKQEPYLAGVLRGAFLPRVFVVPLFISEGYFTQEVIPRELGFANKSDGTFETSMTKGSQAIYYCGPIGTDPSMTQVLLARASQVIEKFPFPRAPQPADITLFVAGHGTGNNENSRKAIENQVALIRDLHRYAAVHAIFMEESPRISDCYLLAQTKNIVVVPFFVSDGLHSYEDIPVMLGEPERIVKQRYAQGQPTWRNPTEKNGKRVWYAASIGTEPLLADVILERVKEAEKGTGKAES